MAGIAAAYKNVQSSRAPAIAAAARVSGGIYPVNVAHGGRATTDLGQLIAKD